MYAIKTVCRNKYFKDYYTKDNHLYVIYSDKLEEACLFDNLDAAIYHMMMMIELGVPIKYFMEMHFCIVEVQHSYKELLPCHTS